MALTREKIVETHAEALYPFYSGRRELRREDLHAFNPELADFVLNSPGVSMLAAELYKGLTWQAEIANSGLGIALEKYFYLTLVLGIVLGQAFEREAQPGNLE